VDRSPFVTATTTITTSLIISSGQRSENNEESSSPTECNDGRANAAISDGVDSSDSLASDDRQLAPVLGRSKEHRRRRRRWPDQIGPAAAAAGAPLSSLTFVVVALLAAALYIPVAPVFGIRQSLKPHYPIERAIGE
jgi:hypothetical protein